ncbi:MAG TPA: hypothetical protein VGW40_05390 [Allosphingosinicella sp.]|nr:hypothetical protein [Allosphingosinicella sp.]
MAVTSRRARLIGFLAIAFLGVAFARIALAIPQDPTWSDDKGWDDVTNYSTIQAVGVGNELYLLARANAGMITLRFDLATNRWINVAVNDPVWADGNGWADVTNYSTIQAVGVGNELYLLARANAGMITLRYDRATDHWVNVAVNDPVWADSNGWGHVSHYSTIQAVGAGSDLYLLARANAGMITLRYNRDSDRWDSVAVNDPVWADSNGWDHVSHYSTIQAVDAGSALYLLARANRGMIALFYNRARDRWVNSPLTSHALRAMRHSLAILSDDEADSIFAEASSILQSNDGPFDVPCSVVLLRAGPVTTFADTDGTIDTSAELETVFGLNGNVKVVERIDFCGVFNVAIRGCGGIPGSSFIVERVEGLDGMIWAHEFGHNRGLFHRDDLPEALMYFRAGATHRRINRSECTAFGGTPLSEALIAELAQAATQLLDEGQAVADSTAVTGRHPVVAFVRQVYIHGVPLDEAARFGSDAVAPLLALLNDRRQVRFHENAALVLGMIGDARAFEPLAAYIARPPVDGATGSVDSASRAHQARVASIIAIGYLANRANSDPAVAYLIESTNPEIWRGRRFQPISHLRMSAAEQEADLSKYAIFALGLSGDSRARAHLLSLRGREAMLRRRYGDAMNGVVEQSLSLHAEVSRRGLVAYYGRRQAD